jgi:hypothetical protein
MHVLGSKTKNAQWEKNKTERVVALEKQPQREIRVVAVRENDHNASWSFDFSATTRSGVMKIPVVCFYSHDVMWDKFQPVQEFMVTLIS